MHFQFALAPFSAVPTPPQEIASTTGETIDLLREMLDVQKEQLTHMKASAAAHDQMARWRGFLARWQEEFPSLGENCRRSLPVLEQTYARLIADLTEQLSAESDPLESDFALQEFLDRYGMRLAQLGTILNLVAPLAEAGPPQNESA